MNTAIVGAGLSGLACARVLLGGGASVQVFDKGRRPGGRISTRRSDAGTFDHGAQYFTARDPSFIAEVVRWQEAGVADAWSARVVSLGAERPAPTSERWVGAPTMSAIARHLADGVPVTCGVRVGAVERAAVGWRLVDDAGAELGRFDRVVLALPAGQAAVLLPEDSSLRARAAAVQMAPCWAVMVELEPWDAPFDAAFVAEAPVSWAARDSSKPGRPPGERWVLHGAPAWSEQHWEDEPATVIETLFEAFAAALPPAARASLPRRRSAAAHRWRYALPTRVEPEIFLYDTALGLGACGDWCGGPRVEGAFLSGLALGRRLEQDAAPGG